MLASAGALMLATAVAGCAQPSHFTTMLGGTGGLGPGDPVTHAGAVIGKVTSVSPTAGGDSEIGVEIDSSHANVVRQDSIFLLSQLGGTPGLELSYTDPAAQPAPDGSFIDGASNPAQAQMLIGARGQPSLSAAYGRLLGNLAGGTGPQPTSATAMHMYNDLMALWQATAGAAAANAPAARDQLDQVQRDEQTVEHELNREGHTDEARSLHDQMDRFLAAVNARSNTYVAPQVYPTPSP
ncbi:MAG TPA: MlaD family protein [Candidatus Binataceae bacterium]|nr:MlaD family protein [Candidatus Binataceae bacterium]